MIKEDLSDFFKPLSIQKIKSDESVLRSPKSFAEEIAEALCKRAETLRNSHPSIIHGKEIRVIEGLLNVAEAVRKADDSGSSKEEGFSDAVPHILLADAENVSGEDRNMIQRANPLYPDLLVGDDHEITIESEANFKTSNWIKMQVNGRPRSSILERFTEVGDPAYPEFQALSTKSDSSETSDLPWYNLEHRGRKNAPFAVYSCPPATPNIASPRRRKARKFSNVKKKDSLLNIIRSKFNNKTNSDCKLHPREDRIREPMESDSMKSVGKRLQSALSHGKKTAGDTFVRLKGNIITAFKI